MDTKSELLLTKTEIDTMIDAAMNERRGRRDSLMMRLLRCTGIRRCEVSRLSPNQLNAEQSTTHVIGSKAKKWEDRIIPTDRSVMRDLQWYHRDQGIKPREKIFGIGDRQVDKIVQKYAVLADIGHPVICHDLRAYFITYGLHYGVPLFTMQKWAGHKSPLTTQLYYRLPTTIEQSSYEDIAGKL